MTAKGTEPGSVPSLHKIPCFFNMHLPATGRDDEMCRSENMLTNYSGKISLSQTQIQEQSVSLTPPLLSLSLSHSLHLDYAPSCGQFCTATGEKQPHPFLLLLFPSFVVFFFHPSFATEKKRTQG